MNPFFFSLLIVFTFSLLYYNKLIINVVLNPIMMISFCRKITPHSFLGLTTTTTTTSKSTTSRTSLDAANHEKLPLKCSAISGGGGLLGLVTAPNYDIVKHQSLVLESSSIKSATSSSDSSPSPPSTPPPSVLDFETKKDPGKIGFIDDIGGGVDGLMSCTESLGFESSDERRVEDHPIVQGISHFNEKEDQGRHEDVEEDACLRMMKHSMKRVSRCTRMGERKLEANKFPPPLSSLNQNGQPRYYLRPVRKDGRLELTEVRIYRPEIMRAYREDGRLRLHLVSHEPHDLQEEEEEEEDVQEEIEEEVIDEEENITNVKDEDSIGGEWKLKVGGEGFRRCQNLVSRHNVHHQHNHHHGNLPVWSQQQYCVTTR